MPATDIDEAGLIAKSCDGDTTAFESLYRVHAARVYGLCLRITSNEAEAQDCTQDTFIKAWRRLSEFRGDSSLATWLHRIAVNEALGRKRKAYRERSHLELVVSESHESGSNEESDVVRELERAIRRLPERAREAFVLNKIYGYTHQQVSRMLDIAVGTSKAQVHRATKLLHEALPGLADSARRSESDRSGARP